MTERLAHLPQACELELEVEILRKQHIAEVFELGQQFADLRLRLGELGFYHGVVDGVMGPRTRAAITAFEDTHGMGVDGTITAALLDRMGLT